jgi:hypothetical protein
VPSKASKFFALSPREKTLFLEAVLLQIWAGFVLKIVPFRRIPGLFADTTAEGMPGEAAEGLYSQQQTVTGLITRAVQRAAYVSPWKNRCLVSSLAARCMLRRRKIFSRLSLGMARDKDGRTVAHAWLRAGDIEVVRKDGDYTELFLF